MTIQDVGRLVSSADATSSKTGTFYFAYGSNLSPSQMSLRLRADPTSVKPVAIARLDAHAWIICQRGYANVVASSEASAGASVDESTVWGLVYNLSADDEARLDKFEGHDESRNPFPEINPTLSLRQKIPYTQGNWDYNKHYLPVTVTKWLADPNGYGVKASNWAVEHGSPTSVRVLVYVDELRTTPGRISWEYIGRMNRAIRESVELGLPQAWVDAVMRQYIPSGVEVDHEGYVGNDNGYVEAEATEFPPKLGEPLST